MTVIGHEELEVARRMSTLRLRRSMCHANKGGGAPLAGSMASLDLEDDQLDDVEESELAASEVAASGPFNVSECANKWVRPWKHSLDQSEAIADGACDAGANGEATNGAAAGQNGDAVVHAGGRRGSTPCSVADGAAPEPEHSPLASTTYSA
jgi:hypothetical protein